MSQAFLEKEGITHLKIIRLLTTHTLTKSDTSETQCQKCLSTDVYDGNPLQALIQIFHISDVFLFFFDILEIR